MHQLDLYFLPAEGETLLRSRNPLQTVNPQTQKTCRTPRSLSPIIMEVENIIGS